MFYLIFIFFAMMSFLINAMEEECQSPSDFSQVCASDIVFPTYVHKWPHPGFYANEEQKKCYANGADKYDQEDAIKLKTAIELMHDFLPEKKLAFFSSQDWEMAIRNFNNLYLTGQAKGLCYRKKNIYIFDNKGGPKPEDLRGHIDQDMLIKGTEEEKIIWKQFYKKLSNPTFNYKIKDAKEEERALLKKYLHIPSKPEEIASEMEAFYKELTQLVQNNGSVFYVTAFIGTKLAEIFPFKSGNGVTTRYFFNLALLAQRKKPIVFFDGQSYVNALRCKEDSLATLKNYLKDQYKLMLERERNHYFENPTFCKICFKAAWQSCSKCNAIFYCSKECQTENWKEHKQTCCIKIDPSTDINEMD